jgi:hypothetical protein
MSECHRILKPSGIFCFMEPNRDTWLDGARQMWYKRDKKFHETERGLSYGGDLKQYLTLGFVEEDFFVGGNIAYLCIAQAHLTRLPSSLIALFSRPLFCLERRLNSLPGCPKLFFGARWRKTP